MTAFDATRASISEYASDYPITWIGAFVGFNGGFESVFTRQLSQIRAFGWLAGAGALELGSKWKELEPQLAIPRCPFGIMAGRLPEGAISILLVDGPSDILVTVEETKLAGAADFLEVPVLHTFLMDNPMVKAAIANFLKSGTFN